MQRVEAAVRVPAAPDALFAYLADLECLPEWQSGVVSARRTSGGEMGVGATAHIARQLMGHRMEARLTVTEYEPPRRLSISSEVSGVRAVAILDLAETDGGAATSLTFAMEIRGSLLTAFMEPMIASAAAADIRASLERLQQRFANDR